MSLNLLLNPEPQSSKEPGRQANSEQYKVSQRTLTTTTGNNGLISPGQHPYWKIAGRIERVLKAAARRNMKGVGSLYLAPDSLILSGCSRPFHRVVRPLANLDRFLQGVSWLLPP